MTPSTQLSLIRVALVEDDVRFQAAFASAIEAVEQISLVAIAGTRAEGLKMLDSPPADVLVADLGLPDGSGIDVIRCAATKWPDCDMMVSTLFGDEAHVLESIEAGAAGYLLKDATPQNIMNEIRSLHNGGSPVSPLIARQILRRFREDGRALASARVLTADEIVSSAASSLSARESEVLVLITKGFTYDEVANLMQISRYTVRSFVRRIYAKLKVNSKAEAIFEARHQGLLAD